MNLLKSPQVSIVLIDLQAKAPTCSSSGSSTLGLLLLRTTCLPFFLAAATAALSAALSSELSAAELLLVTMRMPGVSGAGVPGSSWAG